MLQPLIHYELDMAHQYQDQLRRRAALWDLAQQAARSARGHRLARPGPQIRLALVVILLGFGVLASQLIHW